MLRYVEFGIGPIFASHLNMCISYANVLLQLDFVQNLDCSDLSLKYVNREI